MNEYFVPLVSKKEIAESTMAFEFEKPKDFTFQAGQSIDMTLGTQIYPFSIAASPNENLLRIVTRMRDSEFKNNLKKLKLGEKVRIQGPSGDFTLRKKSDKPIVMLAGGIGITPFYSMIRRAREEKLPHKISLYYRNTVPARAAFLDELKKYNVLISDLAIDTTAVYYMAGPPAFVAKYRARLDEAGIDEDFIKTEEFDGY